MMEEATPKPNCTDPNNLYSLQDYEVPSVSCVSCSLFVSRQLVV